MTRTCLITGGARGIGRALATLAAADGWDIAVGYRERQDAALAVVRDVEAQGRKAVAVQGDVANEADIVAMFDAAEKALGPIRGVVNSAGTGYHAEVADFAAPDLVRLFAVNVQGLMLACREATRRMRQSGGGSIVNVSSMAATIGGRPGASAYAASKAAVDTFTTGFAKEVAAQGIRVNAVRPGVTLTDMTAAVRDDPTKRAAVVATIPMHRAAAASEVAEAILWLLSDKASFVTGAHLNVSGGGFVVGVATR